MFRWVRMVKNKGGCRNNGCRYSGCRKSGMYPYELQYEEKGMREQL